MTKLFSYLQAECNLQPRGQYWFGGTSDFDSLCYFETDDTWYQFSQSRGGRLPAALHYIGGVPWREAFKQGEQATYDDSRNNGHLQFKIPKHIEMPRGRTNTMDEYLSKRGVSQAYIIRYNITSDDESVFLPINDYRNVKVGVVQRNKNDNGGRYINHFYDGALKLWPVFDIANNFQGADLIVVESIWSAIRINQILEQEYGSYPIRAIGLCGCGFTKTHDKALSDYRLWSCGDYGRAGTRLNKSIENRKFGDFCGTIDIPKGYEVDKCDEDFVKQVVEGILNEQSKRSNKAKGTALSL